MGWFGRPMKNNPCKPDCELRSATCHATCKKYKEAHEEHVKETTELKRARYIATEADRFQTASMRETRKHMRTGEFKK